ncbi:MAG: NAD-dependent epimerase/dehydratase family protein [Myxococcales bacterium]|nr:NAD-dependent epimerase/dehydratase family protein [Myxococcales bacterium]
MAAELLGEHVLVTGGAGFIGSHVVEALLERGARVVVLDNFSTGSRENLAPFEGRVGFRCIEADITSSLWPALFSVQQDEPIDRIIHLAAQTSVPRSLAKPIEDIQVNQVATLQLLEFARGAGVKKVVFASSAATYGDLEAEQTREDMPTVPLSPYGLNKLTSEGWLRTYALHFAVPTASLRFFNVFGPRQDPRSPYSGVISLFLQRALLGQDLLVFGDGRQTRDFVFVDDIVQALLLACFGPVSKGEAINVGTGRAITITRLVELVMSLCESQSRLHYADARAGEIKHSCADISLARHLLGYQPTIGVEEGLARTLQWMQDQMSDI